MGGEPSILAPSTPIGTNRPFRHQPTSPSFLSPTLAIFTLL
jgi:hypothetical protein